jgi:hypothetical protein
MEPEWSKQISNPTVCQFFYVLAVVYAIFVVLGLISYIFGVSALKGIDPAMKFLISLLYSFSALVIITFYFFMFLLCDRSIGSKKEGFARTAKVYPQPGLYNI